MATNTHSKEDIRKIQRREYIKSASDPEYFMTKYCKIQHDKKGRILFKLYPYQRRVLKEIEEYRFNIILKARQMGVSTLMSAYALWLSIFNQDQNTLIVSLKQKVAANIVKKAKIMYKELPKFMQIGLTTDNKRSVGFSNDSIIQAETTTGNAGRSESLSFLIMDEAAFIKEGRELWSSVQATFSQTGGHAIVLSTPLNIGDWFHETWSKAVSGAELVHDKEDREVWKGTGTNEFHPIKLHWELHPERDQVWRNRQSNKLPEKKAAREYDCKFEASGTSVVDLNRIQEIERGDVSNSFKEVNIYGSPDLRIWNMPREAENYIVSSDVARGDEDGDWSTIQVFSVEHVEQMAEYKGHVHPSELGKIIMKIGKMYNNALAVVERNNYGFTTLQRMIDDGYENTLYSSSDYKIVEVAQEIDSNKKVYPGLKTTSKTRPLMVNKFEEYMRKGYATIYSRRLTEEMKTFVWKTHTRAEHMQGFHDDLIFAAMFAFWTRDTALRIFGSQNQSQSSMVSSIDMQSHTYTGRKRNSQNNKSSQGAPIISSSKNKTGNDDDISWLY